MEEETFDSKVERSIGTSTTTARPFNGDDSSDEDESYKSCTGPFSVSSLPVSSQGDDDKIAGERSVQIVPDSQLRCPPNISDDSADTFSENGSDEIYYSEMDNNADDSDISNPARENVSANAGEIEISFQRELLDYLGSFFNVESRFRLRESRQSVMLSDDQLVEYARLRAKVNKDLKVLGVGNSRHLASSEQNIARNLHYLLAARERGDWTSCRRYSRVVPMWSFEKHDRVLLPNPGDDIKTQSPMTTGIIDEPAHAELSGDGYETSSSSSNGGGRGDLLKEWTDGSEDGDERRPGRDWINSNRKEWNCEAGASEDDDKTGHSRADIDENDRMDKEEGGRARNAMERMDVATDPHGGVNNKYIDSSYYPDSPWNAAEMGGPSKSRAETSSKSKRKKLVFKNTQKVKYLRDVAKKEERHPKKDPAEKDTRTKDVVTYERVQRDGVWDIKSAVYGSRWSVRRLGLECRFNAHDGCVNALDFSSGGYWIASGSDDRHLVITDWQQKQQLSKFTVGHSSNIFQVRFLPGSNDLELVSCSRDSTVRYAALSSTGQLQYSRLLTKHNGYCHKMDVPLDQPCLVISAGEDTCVLGSDVRAAHGIGKICSVDKVPLYTISCSPVRSQEFAVAGKDSRVFIFDRRKPSTFLNELCPENLASKARGNYHVTSVKYRKDGESVLASYNDDDIYLLSTWAKSDSPVTLHRYQGHRNVQTVTGVSFYGPQHEYVVSGSNDGHVLLWERDTEALVNWFRADENGVVNVLEPHPSMPILATAGLDHDIKMWSMLAADGEQDRTLPLDRPLLELDAETSRIDNAWRKLDEQQTEIKEDCVENVPFNLRNLKVITALNWKMRDDSYPYSIDNNLDNLIFMSRRRRGENQFRGIFISDSDSADSYDSVPDLNEEGTGPGNSNPHGSRSNRDSADTNRPDTCRSS